MTKRIPSGPSPVRCPLGTRQPTPFDANAVKRNGWRGQGLLVVSEQDPRLTWPERELIRQIGDKLFGQRHSTGSPD